jgi:simple sugar transport system permease protein
MNHRAIRKSLTQGSALYFLLFLIVFCGLGLTSPKVFLGQYNLQSMACQVPEFGILALGMMVAIITGGIDLSIISNAILSGIIASLAMYKYIAISGENQSAFMVMIIISIVCAATGLVLGLFNGVLVSYLKIPAILATLGTMKLYDGLSTVITDGQPLRNYPKIVSRFANDNILLMPASFYLFIIVCFLLWIVMEKTKTGQEIYLYGESPKVSRYSGLNNNWILLKAYGICGIMAALSGLTMMSRFNSVKVGYGSTYQLLTILVAIMGGVHPNGGKGNVLCVVFSVLMLQCIASGFNILNFSNYVRNIIYGAVLILVMIVYVVYPIIANRRALKTQHKIAEK